MGPIGVPEVLVIVIAFLLFGIVLFVAALTIIFLLKVTGIADVGPAVRRYLKRSDPS